MNNNEEYICDAEEFGFDCTYPNCGCAEDDLLDLGELFEEDDEEAYDEEE